MLRRSTAVLILAFFSASFHFGSAIPFSETPGAAVTKVSGGGGKPDSKEAVQVRKSSSQDLAAGCKRPPVPQTRRWTFALLLPAAATPSSAAGYRAERRGPKYLLSFFRGTSHSRCDPPV